MMEVIATVFNFAVVVFVLWHFGRKPILDFLSGRAKTIGTQIKEAESASTEAEKQLHEWETNWKSSETHARQHLEDVKASLAKQREMTLVAARTEADRVRHEAKLVGETEVVRARQGLGKELAEKSVQVAGQYLRTHLEEPDRHRLVNEYVEKLANGKAG